ncbi:hypothetical protein [Agriterribacter sp.]|uniref:hypothetical protein n=1 Tax=Agriterribacter sp. TaxID=2821509 RepID=UPI002C87F97B|nr:hypothetical protein [Agriterribacter sp.]HTN08036.1 hypothetical protein [Agriterribacter sp.]
MSQTALILSYTASIQIQSSYHLCCVEVIDKQPALKVSGAATIPKTGGTEKPDE